MELELKAHNCSEVEAGMMDGCRSQVSPIPRIKICKCIDYGLNIRFVVLLKNATFGLGTPVSPRTMAGRISEYYMESVIHSTQSGSVVHFISQGIHFLPVIPNSGWKSAIQFTLQQYKAGLTAGEKNSQGVNFTSLACGPGHTRGCLNEYQLESLNRAG